MYKKFRIVIILLISIFWLLSGHPVIWRKPRIPPHIGNVEASSGTIRPDGDSIIQWTSTGSNHWTEIDEVVTQPTAGTTTDNVNNGGSASNVDQFTMQTISGVGQVTEISVWVYGACDKANSVMSVDLYYSGSTQNLGTVMFPTKNVYSWQEAVFSGLTVTQSDLDNLEVIITGDGGGRTYTVATLYADVTYSLPVSISLTTDGAVGFGFVAENETIDTTSSGINDPEIISIDAGPADLDVRSTVFSDGANPWTLGISNGSNQVKWEFSKDGSAWTIFALADTLYTFDANVAQSQTRTLYLRLTSPSSTSSYNQYGATVTIVASAP